MNYFSLIFPRSASSPGGLLLFSPLQSLFELCFWFIVHWPFLQNFGGCFYLFIYYLFFSLKGQEKWHWSLALYCHDYLNFCLNLFCLCLVICSMFICIIWIAFKLCFSLGVFCLQFLEIGYGLCFVLVEAFPCHKIIRI